MLTACCLLPVACCLLPGASGDTLGIFDSQPIRQFSSSVLSSRSFDPSLFQRFLHIFWLLLLGRSSFRMIHLRFTYLNETAVEEQLRPLAAFETSDSLCSSCTDLLDSPLGEQVLLRSTFGSLTRSSTSCRLCMKIRQGLLGAANGATDVINVYPGCKLRELVNDSEQPTQIWGLRQISHHSLTDSSSELEFIMTKGFLEISLTNAATIGIRRQEVPWGLNTIKYNESTECPYVRAFTPHFSSRDEFWDDIQQGLSWRTGWFNLPLPHLAPED